MTTAIAFFNNKGGVGKTTLACNFAHHLATSRRAKTLVLDLDPQCNSTQLMLDESVWETLYGDRVKSQDLSILAPLRPIRLGNSAVDLSKIPTQHAARFAADIVPGHPTLSTLEDRFSTAWTEFKGADPGGASRTTWLTSLLSGIEQRGYEFVVVDVGPSLGALNRTVLLAVNYFVTPTAPDLFSLFALDNIAGWLDEWEKDYERAAEDVNVKLRDLGAPTLPAKSKVSRAFLGFTVQQYYTTIRGGRRRSIKAYDQHRDEIPKRAAGLISRSPLKADELDLGTVPNMFSMIPLAQSRHAPIADLGKADGVLGAQVNQRARYAAQLKLIFEALAARMG